MSKKMPNIKEEIKIFAKRLETEEVSESEILSFLEKNRNYLMVESKQLNNVTKDSMPEYVFCTTCSCGHETRNDSCQEDGKGYYSEFYLNPETGEVIRNKLVK